jgi:hypothetical protein
MGLVNLTTNLKSLRYGKDRIGGGSSNQPYIKKDIPDSFSDVGRTGGPDVILRGGTLVPGRAAKDVSRLAQMFFDFKSIGGPLFIAKENLLSRTSVATDGQGKALNNGVYLPTSTLLQSAGNSLGLHLNKQGIDPFKGIGKNGGGIFELFGGSDPLGQPSYVEITSNGEYKSKLLEFTDKKINQKTDSTELLNYQGGPGSILGIGKTRIPLSKQRTGLNNPNLNYAPSRVSWPTKAAFQDNGFGFNNSLNITQNTDPFSSNFSFTPGQYIIGSKGKPDVIPFRSISPTISDPEAQEKINNDQFLRLGATVKYASKLHQIQDINPPLINSYLNAFKESWHSNGKLKLNPESFTVSEDIIQKESSKNNPTIQEDFRIKSDPNTASFRLDYTRQNIEQRVGLGNPGKKKSKEQLANYQEGIGELDKINSLRLYKSGVVTPDTDKNDLVKFRIGIIQNDNPSEKIFIHFRAFLDSMSDDYTADWSGEKLMGRGEQFYRYNGFDRKISLGWTVAAQSKDELMPMYQKLNYLASTLAPDYSKSLGYMRGNLATLTVGGYLYEQPGIITSLNYQIPEESPWEIAIPTKSGASNNNGILSDRSVKEMPHMIKVTGFNFIPIHEFTPRTQQNKFNSDGKLTSFGKERYIALDNGVNSNYDSENYIK